MQILIFIICFIQGAYMAANNHVLDHIHIVTLAMIIAAYNVGYFSKRE